MERLPHPLFTVYWTVWYSAVIAALAMPDRVLFGLIVLLAFLPAEALAVKLNTGMRDTLSELATWIFRKLSKHRKFARGWTALLLLIVLTIAYLLARTTNSYTESVPLAVAMFALTSAWLYDHWLSPDVHG